MLKNYTFSGAIEVGRSSQRMLALLLVLFLLLPALLPIHSAIAAEQGSMMSPGLQSCAVDCVHASGCDPLQKHTVAEDLSCCGVQCLVLLTILLPSDQGVDATSFSPVILATPPGLQPLELFHPPRPTA